MRVGIVDCGTNTVRLLIADGSRPVVDGARQVADGAGASATSGPGASTPGGSDPLLTDVVRVLRFVRLGQGVDATHRFHPDALARTFAALDEFAAMIAEHGPLDKLRFLATSAARDATNREEFCAGVKRRLGVAPDVISGDEEARLSFLGALAGGPVAAGPVLVMDIGGGSTELIRGDATGAVTAEHSFDIGSVRLRERFLHDDPPAGGQVAAARDYVASLIDGGGVALSGVGTFVGVAGTNTSLSAMRQGLTDYDATRVHNSVLTPDDVAALAGELLASRVASVRQRYPFLEPMRAEVICAGALICDEVARRVRSDMLVRETDILDGAALDLLRRGEPASAVSTLS